MCVPGLETAFAALTGSGTAATVTGATAGASLSSIGTALTIGGSLAQGIAGYQSARANRKLIAQQQESEKQLNAVNDQRERLQFMSSIRKQAAEIAARGLGLNSPTAVYLGQSAAREMSFQSQATQSSGQARQNELSAESTAYRSRAVQSLLRGSVSAAGAYLNRDRTAWPELIS
jgi:uncharacterized protein HemX